ncbi:MAG TPA: UDP-3-O-acyl-N-acetylglucosamine deacetylase [Nitrospiria bacterium]
MYLQQTIKQIIQCSGIGVHSGKPVAMRLVPAPVNTGIIFLRKTDHGLIPVKVDGTRVVGTTLSTTIGENGTKVQTVEHLLSALSGLRITNLLIELDSGELPIMDGSAMPFVELVRKAGIQEQGVLQPYIRITHPIEIREDGKWIILRPSEEFRINCTIRFDHPLLSLQTFRYEASPEAFIEEIAPARTFGFLHEVEALRSHGLALGGSLDNAVVIGPEGVLNSEGLRFADEFVRHKVLDLIGDLSLIGLPILGEVEAFCPGHQLNTKLVTKMLASTDSWELVSERPSTVHADDSPVTAPVLR